MAVVKAVPDGAELVEITEMVNAGTFWVTSKTSSSEKWNKFLSKAKLTAAPKYQPPVLKELVAVNDHQTGKWHRGRVEALPRFARKDYKVFLIDHGRTIEVPQSAIRDIDEFYAKQEPVAFMIVLVGIIPVNPVTVNLRRENLAEVSQWSFQANMFVKSQIAESSIGYFCQKSENAMNDVKHGELFLIAKHGFIDLGLLLCVENYATAVVKAAAAAKENYSNSVEKDITFQENQRRKNGKSFQNPNHPVVDEIVRGIGVNTQEEKKSALKTSAEMYEKFRLQESLHTDTQGGNVDKLRKTQLKTYKCNQITNLPKTIQKYEEEEEEDSMSNFRKLSGKELHRVSLEEDEFPRNELKNFTKSKNFKMSRPAHRDIEREINSQRVEWTKGCNDLHTQVHCQENDLCSDKETLDEDPACFVTHSERDVGQKFFSLDKNVENKPFIYTNELFKSQEPNNEDISHGVTFGGNDVGKTSLCFDRATENIHESSTRHIKQNLSHQYKSSKANKYGLSLVNDPVCGEDDVACDERNVIKKSFSPHEDTGNRSYPKNSNFNRKSNVSIEFQDFNRTNKFISKHDLSQVNKKSYKGGVTNISENDLRNKIKGKETFDSYEDSEKPGPLGDNETFDENSKSCVRAFGKDLKTPFVLPQDNPSIVSSMRCDVHEVAESELKNDSFKCSTQTKSGEDFDSDSISGKTRSVLQVTKRPVKSKPILTFFPAGFNMGEADKLFAKKISPTTIKQKPSNSAYEVNSLNSDADTRRSGYANRITKKNSEEVNTFVHGKVNRQNFKTQSYYKLNKLWKHMDSELDNKHLYSFNSENHREEVEINSPTRDGVMTSPPESKQHLLVDSPHELNYSSSSEDHEILTNFYRNSNKETEKKIEFVAGRKQQQNRLGSEEHNKFLKHTNAALDEHLQSSNFGECGREEFEVNSPIGKGIITSSPRRTQNLIVDLPHKLNYSSKSKDHKSVDNFYINPKKEAWQINKFVTGGNSQRNQLDSQDYGKETRFPKHMNAELDEEHSNSCNSEEHGREEIEVNLPTFHGIMTSLPKSKQNHIVDSLQELNYSNESEDHESLDNFYRNSRKDAGQMTEFVSEEKLQQNKLKYKECNKFSEDIDVELDEEPVGNFPLCNESIFDLHNRGGNKVKSPTCEEVETASSKLVVSCEVDKSCVSEFSEKVEEIKLESMQSAGEFGVSSELETSDVFEKTLLPQPNIEQRFFNRYTKQQIQGVNSTKMSKDISFPETSDRTEQTPLSQKHHLLSAIQEYIAATDLAQGDESITCIPLLQQVLKNLSVEGVVDTKAKGMVNKDMKDSKISNTVTSDGNKMIDNVKAKEHIKKSNIKVTSEPPDTISSVGLCDMQNELQKMTCETPFNMTITMLNDVSEQKLKELNIGSPSATRNVSEIIEVDVLTKMTNSIEVSNGEISEDFKMQDVSSVLEKILENVSERVMLNECSKTLIGEDLEVGVQESLNLVGKKDSSLKEEEGQNMEEKGPNVAQDVLNDVIEEVQKTMKNNLKIVVEENTNIQVDKSLNVKEKHIHIETKEDSNDVVAIESTSYEEVGENLNVEAKRINIEIEDCSNLKTKTDMIIMVDENSETVAQKSYEIKMKDSVIAEEFFVEDSNYGVEERPREENSKLTVSEGSNISVKDEIEIVEGFVSQCSDMETEIDGQIVLKAATKDGGNTVEGDTKCATMEGMETILTTACAELKEVVTPVPVEVYDDSGCHETKVMVKDISQASQIHSSLGTSDESKSISEDILENNSPLPKSSSEQYETVPSTDTSTTEKENLIERAQISEEQSSTRNTIKSSTRLDLTKKSGECRITGVEPDLFLNTPRKIMDQLQMMIVLLHGAPEGFRHLNAITDAAFRMDVHEVLKTIMSRMMRIQKYVWPLILQGYSVVMVSPPISGKTLGYAVPLLDMVMQNVHCNQIPKGHGPVMLVLCSGSKNCNEIQGIFSKFIKRSSKDIKMLVAFSGGPEKMELKLVNGCHILISTPRCFKRLCGLGKVVVDFERLKYLVLDEADVLTLRFLPEIEYILKCIERGMKPQDKVQLQVVTAAEKWCPAFDGLVKSLIKPVVCIGAFLEALVYAHFKPHVHFVTQNNRIAIVKKIVEKSSKEHHTLILCRDVDEVKTLRNVLKFCHRLLYAHDNMDASDIHGVYMKWSCRTKSVLLCTDNIFQEMPFQGASQVVHFSLGDISKREFAHRCSAVIDHLPSIFENQENKNNDVEPQMHIFISDTDSEPLPTLVSLLKRLGVPVDPDLQKRANEAECMKEMGKDSVPLCHNTKSFGDCWNRSKCIYRHIICNKDEPRNIPVSGTVKVKILYTHNACNYSARLLEHVNKKGEVKAIPNCLLSLAKKLHLYFKVKEHRILLENPKTLDLCAFEKNVGIFLRTEILAVTKADKNKRPIELFVRYIDDGGRDIVKADEVFVLPEDLKEIPPQSVELYLCRLVPCDLDWSWGTVTNKKVDRILADADGKARFLIGKIKLSLGHTLWLDPLECFESLGMLKTSTIIFSLRRKLLDEGLAVENPQHLQLLYQACARSGLDISCTDTSETSLPAVKCDDKEEIISWAYLPVDEFSLVYLIVGDHPGRFYVRQKKFEELVYKLDKKLLKLVKEKGTTDRTLFTGDYCIGKFPTDNRWYRARIEKAQDDTLDLFFVDHGDRATVSRSEAVPLPKNFISQLPFQAIECCLAGIGPDKGDMWSEQSLETLYGITSKPGTIDGVKLLYAKVMDKVKPADCTGGYKYHVALIEVTSHGQALLNDSLVAWNVASQTEEQKLLLKKLDFSHLTPPLDLDPCESEEDEEELEEHSLNDLQIVVLENWNNVQEVSPLCTATDDANIPGQSCSPNVSSNSETCLVPQFLGFNGDEVTDEEWAEFIQKSNESYEESLKMNSTSQSGEKEKEKNKLEETAATALEKPLISENEAQRTCIKDIMDLEDTELLPLNTSDYSNSPGDDDDDDDVMVVDCPIPPLEQRTRTPLIYWHQNANFVWLRVDLPGVEKYNLKWNVDNLHFWTVVKELIYSFDLHLFGPINPCTLRHSGGLFVRIKMQKVVVGTDWLRLVVEKKKCQWIKRDYEAENDNDVEDLSISVQLQAVKEMEKKTAAQKHVDALLPADEFEYNDDNDDSDSCCSDVKLPGDEQYDPYDPLN